MRSTTLACALVVACSAACQRDEPGPIAGIVVSDAMAPVPRDHLGAGELLEGTERAFGLLLPRGAKLETVFPQQIVANVPSKAADVANYIRPRVAMGTVKVGAASTMFDRVQIPTSPGRELVIRVEEEPTGSGARVTVRDVTPPPFDPSLTEEQRRRQVGLTPDGKLADPTHLH